MRFVYLFLNVCVKSILAIILPYIVLLILICIYYLGSIIGYFDGIDIMGGEDIIIALLPITVISIVIISLIGVLSNKFIYKKANVSISNYCIFSVSIFLLVLSIIMFTLDPLNIIQSYKYLK